MASSIAADSSSLPSDARSGARRSAQQLFLAQAHVERAGARQAHAVAAFAEIMRHRRDEAELAAGLLDLDIAGRATGLVGNILSVNCPEVGRSSDSGMYWSVRSSSISPIGMVSITVMSMPWPWPIRSSGISCSLKPLSATVDLDLQARRLRRLEAVENLVQVAPAGDLRTCPDPACRSTR
jgi:hypothetical protein